MKKNKIVLILSSFALALCVGTFIGVSHTNKVINEAAVTNAWDTNVKPSVQASYYSAADGKTGTSLKSALAGFNKPTSPSYDWSRYESADEAQDDSNSILCVYTRHNIPKNGHCGSYSWNTWNREHVYTQTKFPKSDKDNHNIFACEGQINNYRGNLKFAEVKNSGGTRVTVFDHVTDCYKTSSYFEPCDEAKGEIARACLYCTIYYGYDLTEIFDSEATALKWNANFTVTPREIYRNNVVQGLQGNRNPFIDHPSYAQAIYGGPAYQGTDPLSPAAGVTLFPTSASVVEGNTVQLTATASDSSAITWTTSNASIATVSQTGVVTGVKAGTATITASASVGSATATITVTEPKTLSNISISGQKTSFSVGGSFVFGGTVTAHYTDSTSSNVTANSIFSGYDMSTEGDQTVTVSYTEGSITKTETYTITVSSSGGGESGTFSTTYTYDKIGDTWNLTDYASQSEYALCPKDDADYSIATFDNIFTNKTITSDVVVTINSATYGSGSTPTSSTYSIYNSADCTTSVTATQSGTLPTSKTYTDVIYTVSNSIAINNFSDDLAIKIVKPGRQIRLKSVTIAFDYETQGGGSPTLASIEVETSPNKTIYNTGEFFDPTGLVITRNYSDGSDNTYSYSGHTSEFTFDPSLSTQLETWNDIIEIFYGGESCLLSIEVNESKTLSSISISGYTTSFDVGESFSFGGTVTAHYSDSTTADVTSSATFTGYNMSIAGNYTVTVTYSEKTATYDITVNAVIPPTPVGDYSLTSGSPYINGIGYKMYFVNSSTYYYTGSFTSSGYYGAASTNYNSAVDVYFEESGNGQNLYYLSNNGSTKNYLKVILSGTYYNFGVSTTAPETKWIYQTTDTYNALTFDMGGVPYTFGSFSNKYEFRPTNLNQHPDNFLMDFITKDGEGTKSFAPLLNSYIKCDASGESAPKFSGFSWNLFESVYSKFSANDKTAYKDATANKEGTAIQQFVARYDYIVGKYGYSDFISRNPVTILGANIYSAINSSENGTMLIVVAIAAISALAFTTLLVIKKKRK